MAKIKHFALTSAPGTWQADSIYFIKVWWYVEIWVTDTSAAPQMVGNSQMINDLIDVKIAGLTGIQIVADITARNALASTLTGNAMVLVVDASADTWVDAWAALYVFKDSDNSWTLIAEYESLNQNITFSWSSIVWKPTSSVADIDSAVASKHTHLNKAVLDKFWEDGDWEATYDWNPILRRATKSW